MAKKKASHVPSGYEIGIDEEGLTARERTVRDLITNGHTLAKIGEQLGITRQRASQIVKSLEHKGTIEKNEGRWRLTEKESNG